MLVRAKEKGMLLLLPGDVLVSGSLDEPQQEHVVVLSTECGCNEDAPCVPAGVTILYCSPPSCNILLITSCDALLAVGGMPCYYITHFKKGVSSFSY